MNKFADFVVGVSVVVIGMLVGLYATHLPAYLYDMTARRAITWMNPRRNPSKA